MTYLPEESKVIYQSKDAQKKKLFDALEWLAAMGSHVPDKGEQMVRYKISLSRPPQDVLRKPPYLAIFSS